MMYADRGSGASHDVSFFEIRPKSSGLNISSTVAIPQYILDSPPKCPDDGLYALSSMNSDNHPNGLTEQDIRNVIANHGPVLHLHPNDLYLPMSVEGFLADAYLKDPTHLDIKNEQTKFGDIANAVAYVFAHQVHPLFTDIQFWFFYGNNGKTFIQIQGWADAPIFGGKSLLNQNADNLNNGEHIGDWEHVTLRVSNQTKEVVAVCYSMHGDPFWHKPIYNSEGKIQAYSALNMHGTYPFPGEHLELASWQEKSVDLSILGSASLDVKIYSRNMCADGGQTLDASSRYQIIDSNLFAVQQPEWLDKYATVSWGQAYSSMTLFPFNFKV